MAGRATSAGPEALADRRHRPTASGRGSIPPDAMLERMGLNPFRQIHRSPFDYVMVALAVLVCVALVAWAFLG